ncbi:MAG: YraN family protein [Pseudomonadota bacterium]
MGKTNYHAGMAAEAAIVDRYGICGHIVLAERWRGRSGELDLVFRKDREIVFVEVKKSRDFATAARHLAPRQLRRIRAAGAEFLAGEPAGQDTECRFDVALVDAAGRIEVIENAVGT